jgi:aspartyl-tRNA(Asn)/glutamyl-tRNA(Gln) amidotransferase subunit A
MNLTRREWLTALAGVYAIGQIPAMGPPHDDLVALDAGDAIARIASRGVSAIELTEAYLQRIETLNPSIGAFVTVTADRARADARRIDAAIVRKAAPGPLAGLPIAHKDLFETAGIRTTAGSRLYEHHVPRRDADIVSALSRAGAVMLGKTNTHELGGGVTTINPFYGTTRNPWDRSRISGGSSGGSAAAVAAGMAAAATGSDTGGSVRIPAALSGCVGFKPSFARLSTRGLLGACPTFDHVGLLTRTVADAALIFNVVTGAAADARASEHRLSGPERHTEPATSVARLRVGIPRGFFFDDLAPDVAQAVEGAITALRSVAANVENAAFPIAKTTMAEAFDPIVVAEIQTRFARDWKSRPDAFSPSFASVLRAERPADRTVDAARRALAAFRLEVGTLFQSVDVLVTPTVPVTAPLIEGPIDGELILRNTWPFNAAGTPALSVPCGFDRQGLPVGLQLVGSVGGDEMVLRLGRAFQAATSWHRERPTTR